MSDDSELRWTGGGWLLPGMPSDAPVVDAHYHIFPRLGSQPKGIPPALRLKFWQYHSREWIDFWRTDTGEHVGERLLEFGSHYIADMPDVGFRLTDHGQAEITIDGVSYRMQIYPPSLTNNEISQWCTYRQSLDFIRVHCDFLSAAEKASILGGNAVRLFGLEPAAPRS